MLPMCPLRLLLIFLASLVVAHMEDQKTTAGTCSEKLEHLEERLQICLGRSDKVAEQAQDGSEFAAQGGEEAEGGKAKGEEAKDKEEEAEDEEEQVFTTRDVEVACMLIGAVVLVVSLFYLVNFPDDDIRFYSMDIISMTLSIFTAVLLFQGINSWVDYWIEGLSAFAAIGINFLQLSIYIMVLQYAVTWMSGLVDGSPHESIEIEKWVIADGLRADVGRQLTATETKDVRRPDALRSIWTDSFGLEVPVEKRKVDLDKRNLWMRCWGMLISHMTGFAAIQAGGTLQHHDWFSSSPLAALAPVIITPLYLQFLFFVSDKYRDTHVNTVTSMSSLKLMQLCHETVVEAENDVSSLAISFLFIQALRFAVAGVLPDKEGREPDVAHWDSSIVLLFGCGVLFTICAVTLAMLLPYEEESHAQHSPLVSPRTDAGRAREAALAHADADNVLGRIGAIATDSCAMSFAWSMLYTTRWICVRVVPTMFPGLIARVMLSLIVTVLSGLAVFLMDGIDDRMRARGGEKAATQAIRVVISALAILVGFSWEHCFHAGVLAVSSTTKHRALTKFILAACVLVFIVPAWNKHILTKVMRLEELKLKRTRAAQKLQPHSGSGNHGTDLKPSCHSPQPP